MCYENTLSKSMHVLILHRLNVRFHHKTYTQCKRLICSSPNLKIRFNTGMYPIHCKRCMFCRSVICSGINTRFYHKDSDIHKPDQTYSKYKQTLKRLVKGTLLTLVGGAVAYFLYNNDTEDEEVHHRVWDIPQGPLADPQNRKGGMRPIRTDLPTFSVHEVAEFGTKHPKRPVLTYYQNGVYDITGYLEKHPKPGKNSMFCFV